MRPRLQVVAVLVALAGLALPAEAQRRARSSRSLGTPVVVSAPAGTRVIRAGQVLDTTRAADVSDLVSVPIPSSATISTLINGSFPVPGFGFDFTHFAAVNRNLGVRAIIDPATQHQLALARDLRRDLGRGSGGFPTALPFINNTNVNQIFITLPPPVVIVQQPAVVEVPVERDEAPRVASDPPVPAAPVAELGELVFIRKDGSLVLAVGYSIVSGRVVYVTREGIRRSFSLSELDAESTRLMNEERGTSLRLPA